MKRIVFFIFEFIYTTSMFAQIPANVRQELYNNKSTIHFCYADPGGMIITKSEKLDTAMLQLTYKVTFVDDTSQIKDKHIDIQILQIGKRVSKCYSYLLYKNDSLITSMYKRGSDAFPFVRDFCLPEDIYTFSFDNKIQVLYRGRGDHLPWYWYTEDIPQIKWTLLKETKTILGYNCNKATCSFRGRDYIAWYSTDIPVKVGPYKFDGLPGAILDITDTNNEYDWECIGIKRGNTKDIIYKYSSKIYNNITTTREKCRNEVNQFHEDVVSAYTANNQRIFYGDDHFAIFDTPESDASLLKRGDYRAVSHDIPPIPYNPIEKE